MNFTTWPVFWGLLGTLIYAGPRFTDCIYSKQSQGLSKCFADAVTAVVVGSAMAASFVPWAASLLKASSVPDIMALSAVVGMLANLSAPTIIEVLNEHVIKKIKGFI